MTDEETRNPMSLAARRAALQSKQIDLTPPTWKPAESPAIKNPRKYYSASARGFFTEEIHGTNMPKDAVEITTSEWKALLEAQSTGGKVIVPGPSGKPIAADPVITPAIQRRRIEAQIDKLRRAPDTLDLQRAAALGKPGAKEQLEAVDKQIESLRAMLPPQQP
jgi:hypothetical protein